MTQQTSRLGLTFGDLKDRLEIKENNYISNYNSQPREKKVQRLMTEIDEN